MLIDIYTGEKKDITGIYNSHKQVGVFDVAVNYRIPILKSGGQVTSEVFEDCYIEISV